MVRLKVCKELMIMDEGRIVNRVSERSSALSQGFMGRVYLWMTLGLAATGAMAYFVASSPAALDALFGRSIWPLAVIWIAELGIVFYLSARVMTLSPATASTMFFVYSVLNGLSLAPIFLVYTGESISTAFFVSAAMFGGMSLYGTVTKRDLSGWGSFLTMGLVGIVIAMVVNMFVGSFRADLVISIIGVIVFTGLAAYDTNKLRRMAAEGGLGEEAGQNLAVLGALTLYLDFVNLFLFLLRIFNRRK
jgi:FtsH-binding integral membrane protein